MAIRLLDRDNRVAQLDQVLLLHVEQLLANLLGFLLGRKRDFYEIGHLRSLHAVLEPEDKSKSVYRRSGEQGRPSARPSPSQEPKPSLRPDPSRDPTPAGTPPQPGPQPSGGPAPAPTLAATAPAAAIPAATAPTAAVPTATMETATTSLGVPEIGRGGENAWNDGKDNREFAYHRTFLPRTGLGVYFHHGSRPHQVKSPGSCLLGPDGGLARRIAAIAADPAGPKLPPIRRPAHHTRHPELLERRL